MNRIGGAPVVSADDGVWLGILWRASSEAEQAVNNCPLPAGGCACTAVALTAATTYVEAARIALAKVSA
jgi:hypothetical protein